MKEKIPTSVKVSIFIICLIVVIAAYYSELPEDDKLINNYLEWCNQESQTVTTDNYILKIQYGKYVLYSKGEIISYRGDTCYEMLYDYDKWEIVKAERNDSATIISRYRVLLNEENPTIKTYKEWLRTLQ